MKSPCLPMLQGFLDRGQRTPPFEAGVVYARIFIEHGPLAAEDYVIGYKLNREEKEEFTKGVEHARGVAGRK